DEWQIQFPLRRESSSQRHGPGLHPYQLERVLRRGYWTPSSYTRLWGVLWTGTPRFFCSDEARVTREAAAASSFGYSIIDTGSLLARQCRVRICVILNPAARGEKANRFLRNLDSISAESSLKRTAAAGDARKLATRAVEEGFDTIIAAG